jgi:hypothetical protein
MNSLFDRGVQMLADRLPKKTVELVRGTESMDVEAVIGESTFQVEDDRGVVLTYHTDDFIIRTADYQFDGRATLPERGDRVRSTNGNQEMVHTVNMANGSPHWRYTDQTKTQIRLHTKLTDTIP